MGTKWTREGAIAALKEGKPLSTGMLEPLGLTMDHFLAVGQMSEKSYNYVMGEFIKKLEKQGK